MISVFIAALVFAQKAPACASDADCVKPKFCACERRIDCRWWPPGFLRLGEKMTEQQITQRMTASACLTESEAVDAGATTRILRVQDFFWPCYADHQCPAGQLCVCDSASCSLRVTAIVYVPPPKPPYTTHMCLPHDALNQFVRRCGTHDEDVCTAPDGGIIPARRPRKPLIDADWVMPPKDGGT